MATRETAIETGSNEPTNSMVQPEDRLGCETRAAFLAGRFGLWSAAMLGVVVVASCFVSVARPQSTQLSLIIGVAQTAAALALLGLTLRAQSCRVLNWGALGAWVWIVAGWAWSGAQMDWLEGLGGLLFAAQAGSGLLLAWPALWQMLLSAAAAGAFIAALAAKAAWHAREAAGLGFVLLGGALGCAIAAALRSQRDEAALSGQRERAFMQRLIHEIRSPAGAISMRVELLREQVADAPTRGALEAIGAAAQRILNLTDNLSDAFQIETGDIRSQPRPVDLNSVVETAAAELASSARSKQIEIEMALDPSLPPLDVDPRHVKRVTANLLDNAVKFTPRGGRVTVSTMASSPWVRMAFKDSGPGIDPRQELSLFAPPKLSARRSRAGGLGLFVAKTMTELCGGKLLVESAPGRGATFTVVIPQGQGQSTAAGAAGSKGAANCKSFHGRSYQR